MYSIARNLIDKKSSSQTFRFKQFDVSHSKSGQKVTTDSVLLGSWIELDQAPGRILDAGAGTGLLSLMAAQKWPASKIEALEIDEFSAEECEDNFLRSPWKERLFIKKDDFACFCPSEKYDLILSNPPYFKNGIKAPDEKRRAARSESALNVISLIDFASVWLSENGTLGMVCPVGREKEIDFQALLRGFASSKKLYVTTVEGKEPTLLLVALSRTGESESRNLVLRHRFGAYTDDYIETTKEFYLFLH